MNRYTVVWSPSARMRLAELWLDNPAIQQAIANSSDEIDRALAQDPGELGRPSGGARYVVLPPLLVLFRILEDDCQVRVIHVQLWPGNDGIHNAY